MALNVKFLKGLASEYAGLETKDVNSFYYTTDDGNLYLGSIKLSNASDLSDAITRIAANETNIGTLSSLTTTERTNLVGAINELKSELSTLIGGESGGIADMIEAVTGKLTDLTTENKGTLVAAINELDAALDTEKTVSKVTITEGTSSEYAKTYTVKQGESTIGTINIPKDMVVSSGTVEVNPEGQAEGTYIVLTLANAASDKIYVNVGSLVDIYTAKAEAAQVQLAIDSLTREISATIVAGSITATELAANAVTTAKIADGNVTLEKLATTIQTSLGKADSAVQSVTTGSSNGTISVDGTSVSVYGLQSAAYADATSFDMAGSAATAETNAKNYTDSALTWQTIA